MKEIDAAIEALSRASWHIPDTSADDKYCEAALAGLRSLKEQEPVRCKCCGTHEVSMAMTCHNSSCTLYGVGVIDYEGWKTQNTVSGCHRSHPHENMDEVCDLKTEIARLKRDIRYRDEVIQQRNAELSTRPHPAPEVKQEPHGYLYDWTHSSALGKPDEHFTSFTKDKAHAENSGGNGNVRPVFLHPAPSVNAQNPTNVGALALNWYDQTMEDEGVITRDALHMFALSLPVSPAPSVSAQESEIVLSRESFLMMGQRIAELEDELHEQARVNGMGSEREAALMAKVERKDAALRVALEALESEDCINVLMQDAIDLIKRELSITSAIPGDTK